MTTTQPTPYLPQHNQAAYTTPPNSQGHPQYNLLQQQRQYSPTTSHPQTPVQNSPSSPQPLGQSTEFLPLPLAKRQVQQSPEHGGRLPYLPAALRPTDPPPRSQPLTPPRSVHGSTDSLDKKGRALSRPGSRRSTKAPLSQNTLTNSDLLSRLPPADVEIALASTSDLPAITGPPTRSGWKPDFNAPICDHATCSKSFNLWERRHHCRRCGNVFCGEHSAHRVPLDQNADCHPLGECVRACEHCAGKWVEWIVDRARSLKEGKGGKSQGEAPTSPVGMTSRDTSENKTGTIVAGSVGVSGDWSTF